MALTDRELAVLQQGSSEEKLAALEHWKQLFKGTPNQAGLAARAWDFGGKSKINGEYFKGTLDVLTILLNDTDVHVRAEAFDVVSSFFPSGEIIQSIKKHNSNWTRGNSWSMPQSVTPAEVKDSQLVMTLVNIINSPRVTEALETLQAYDDQAIQVWLEADVAENAESEKILSAIETLNHAQQAAALLGTMAKDRKNGPTYAMEVVGHADKISTLSEKCRNGGKVEIAEILTDTQQSILNACRSKETSLIISKSRTFFNVRADIQQGVALKPVTPR